MDSLLANYASSDEEEQRQHSKPPSEPLVSKSEAEEEQDFPSKSTSRIFSSLPPPKSSLFNSLPPPKSQSIHNPKPQTNYLQQNEQIDDQVLENSKPKASSSLLFSSLPPPKSSTSASSSSTSTSKRVVQFRPPPMINPFSSGVNDQDEDEDEDEEERQRKKSKASLSTSSAMSFLSSMPAPKNSVTLGALPSALGSGRRCIIESEARDSTESVTGSDTVVSSNVGFVNDQSDEMNYDNSSWSLGSKSNAFESFHGENFAPAVVSSVMENDGGVNSNLGSSEVKSDEFNYDYSGRISGSESYYNHHNGGQFVSVGPEAVDYSYGNEDHSDYPNYDAGYGYYSNNPQGENNLADKSIMTAFPEASGGVENALNVYGKRGRRDAPQDIVEVKQDELMKNRPREDQTKMTGIAFGPAYQPTSTKGKPSKLHKRKHQIGSLLFDLKQKEMELAERRSKGYATKAQTQAKYGW